MVYELRRWSDDQDCLYTDDKLLHEAALAAADLTVVASYFKSIGARDPFAWDIVGPRHSLSPLAHGRHRARRGKVGAART